MIRHIFLFELCVLNIFTQLKLWVAVARHNSTWLKKISTIMKVLEGLTSFCQQINTMANKVRDTMKTFLAALLWTAKRKKRRMQWQSL